MCNISILSIFIKWLHLHGLSSSRSQVVMQTARTFSLRFLTIIDDYCEWYLQNRATMSCRHRPLRGCNHDPVNLPVRLPVEPCPRESLRSSWQRRRQSANIKDVLKPAASSLTENSWCAQNQNLRRKWNTTERGRGRARIGWCLARNQRFGGDWPPPASCRLAKQIRIQKPRPSFTLQPNIYHKSLSLLSFPLTSDFGCECRGWQKKRPDASHDREAPYSSSGPWDAPLLPSETPTDTSTPPQT